MHVISIPQIALYLGVVSSAVIISNQISGVKAFMIRPNNRHNMIIKPLSLSSETSTESTNSGVASTSTSTSSSLESQQEKPKQEEKYDLWKQGRSASASMKLLEQYQKESAHIVQSFVPGEDFNPVQLLGSNNHVQTIGGFLARQSLPELKYVKKHHLIPTIIQAIANKMKQQHHHQNNNDIVENFWDRRDRIETPDGDWFHADYKYADDDNDMDAIVQNNREEEVVGERKSSSLPFPGTSSSSARGLVILMHGLESNSDSPLSKEIANGYHKLGLDVVCLNFRGCSGTPNDTLGGYHLGFTDDLKHYLSLVKNGANDLSSPLPPIYLAGFSLGSNVALKALGELGEAARDEYNIQGAALQCAPLDQEINYLAMEKPGINRQLYSGNLLKSMKTRLQYQLDTVCDGDENTDKFDYPRAMAATKISQLEDAFLGPIYGFDSYLDYYRKTSSIFFLDGIAVPTLIVNSKDDPFFNGNVWPVEKSCENGGKLPIKMIRSDHGGHLGFFLHQIEDEDELFNLHSDPLSPSWCTAECARFINHVHKSSTSSFV